jgi:hypothetical protein
MFKIVIRASGIDQAVGPQAAQDIAAEFKNHRQWHQQVECSFADGLLTLVAFNDYDPKGLALSDEFSDCLSAFIPLNGFADDDGVWEIEASEIPD